jgi:tetratricopeptide (TPR) repeat protein
MHFYRRKEWGKAEQLFKEVISDRMNLVTEEKIPVKVWEAMHHQAYCFFMLNRGYEAVSIIDFMINFDPLDDQVLGLKAIIYLELFNYPHVARLYIKRAIRMNPTSHEHLAMMARVEEKCGNIVNALRYYESLLSLKEITMEDSDSIKLVVSQLNADIEEGEQMQKEFEDFVDS